MKVEVPSCQRCCCCLPLRRGILIFGYLNLLITIFFGAIQVLIWVHHFKDVRDSNSMLSMYRGVVLESHIVLIIILHVLDVVFNIILIAGAHMKNSAMMRWYYYYQLLMMIANFFAMLVTYLNIHKLLGFGVVSSVLSELAVAFLGFALQIYLLLLVHSEISKRKYQEGRSSYANHLAEVFIEPAQRQDRRLFL